MLVRMWRKKASYTVYGNETSTTTMKISMEVPKKKKPKNNLTL
jgi:hypothetical protein